MIDQAQRTAARVVALTSLLTLVVITVAFGRFYAPFLVWNDTARTVLNIAAHEASIRIYLLGALIYGLGVVVLSAALYVVLRPISKGLALFASFSRLVYAFMWFGVLLNLFGVVRMLGGVPPLEAFDAAHLQALAALRFISGWDMYYLGLGFNGLASTVFAYLWWKSRYVPRWLAAWGVVSSVFEGFCGFAYLLFPTFGEFVSVNWYEMPITIFEVGLSAWILVKGLAHSEVAKTVAARA